MIFGRRSGPVKAVLAAVALVVLSVLIVTFARLGQNLAAQAAINQESQRNAEAAVAVTDRLTTRLAQLTRLTDTAQLALDDTRALQPLLVQLRDATRPAADSIAVARAGGETTHTDLRRIQQIVVQLRQQVLPLVPSAAAFGDQGTQLLTILQGVNDDLETSIAAARRINNALPLPG
jgi:fructoselysine-6-P-deglycase FrlB-like protein